MRLPGAMPPAINILRIRTMTSAVTVRGPAATSASGVFFGGTLIIYTWPARCLKGKRPEECRRKDGPILRWPAGDHRRIIILAEPPCVGSAETAAARSVA